MAKKPAPAARLAPKRFELLTLGDELLLGRTPNGHLTFVGGQLSRRGVALEANHVLPDDSEAIASQVARSWARSAVVITTGGLGPTFAARLGPRYPTLIRPARGSALDGALALARGLL